MSARIRLTARAANVHTARKYGPDRVAGFSPIPAMSQLSHAAGCRFLQFDDPVLLRHPDAARAWGLQALERCFAGLEGKATFGVHICRGYPNKPLERKGIRYKADQTYYRDILSWLSGSRLDVVSIEGARQAMLYLPKGQLILAPDCGMLELTRASARQKLVNLALAAREVNAS